MIMLTVMAVTIIFILMAMVTILNLISKKSFTDREKSSPFECGFDPQSSARLPFSLQFFLIAIIFLIFDVEITLLLPMIVTMEKTSMINYSIIMVIFLTILLVGTFHEWNQGALDWSI